MEGEEEVWRACTGITVEFVGGGARVIPLERAAV